MAQASFSPGARAHLLLFRTLLKQALSGQALASQAIWFRRTQARRRSAIGFTFRRLRAEGVLAELDVFRGFEAVGEFDRRLEHDRPDLAIRIIGEVTREKLEVVREANAIVEEELVDRYLPWQCYAAVLGLGTGVKGDNRIHGWIVAVRAVNSRDGMTADPVEIPYTVLGHIASRITAEIPRLARVVYEITPKPPATIEYE